MANSGSSARWRRRQETDIYVQRARREGWRSRAVYKLEEIQLRHKLMRPGAIVVDLGAAPGGWCQYALQCVGTNGRVIGLDILEMPPIEGVEFIHGDFTEDKVLASLQQCIGNQKVDLVMSDLAPNITGTRSVDQPRSMYLVEISLELAYEVLRPGGHFVTKVFHGEGFDDLVKAVRCRFKNVKVRKPKASRPDSRETYLVASGYGL
ncbi:MAG: 23S rRNA (uridine(2552)-2'-O)-methyltransferase RlmE [Chromatiales bacterium]|jgi:23S rRNA (uridine2552-2'-O)-methyltransferase|nr:23S rRNA (uridine(2552)-2'-O)-methyltransferase RlmE [Chromatiales bacterium]